MRTRLDDDSGKDVRPYSRGASLRPGDAFGPCPSGNQRAQGMPGARRTHCLTCKTKKTHAGQHRYAEITPALPAQWFTAYSALSPEYRYRMHTSFVARVGEG